jgi:hypothetical protein
MTKKVGSGLLRAMLDAVHGSDEQIGGQAVAKLRVGLDDDATEILVESTLGFGEFTEGTGNGKLVIGGEIIDYDGRTPDSFTGLTRGVDSTKILPRYPTSTVVYDLAQNTSALDLLRRAFLVRFAIGPDLDQVGRNLGLDRCPGVGDEIWRRVVQDVAYLAKQPPSAIVTALNALQGAGNYTFFERAVTSPNRFFVGVDTPLTDSLQGRFFLNSGEQQVVGAGGVIPLNFALIDVPFVGNSPTGILRVVSGAFLNDGEDFILNDGVNLPVTFEFDDDASVVPAPQLRPVPFTATDTEEDVRDAIIAAITGAGAININASALDPQRVALVNPVIGAAGNIVIASSVSDSVWNADGMAGGADAGTDNGVRVFFDQPAWRDGYRDPSTDLYALFGGTVTGPSELTLAAISPGTPVIVDYHTHPAHYLAPDETFRNDGTDFPPYFADNLLAARCLLDQVRAAGVGVELSVSL